MVREGEEIFGLEDGSELGRQEASVLGAEVKGDQGAGVGDHRVAHSRVELAEILIGEYHADLVLPEFGEHRGERERREDVELVQVDEERPALLLRHVGSRQDRKRKR